MPLAARIILVCSIAARVTAAVAARVAGLFAVALLVAALLSAPRAVHAQQAANYAERALFDAANRERTAQALQPLRWDDALAAAAREHAARMAQRNTLSHQLPGELPLEDRARVTGARYTLIAENVAEGFSADMIHASWMHSPPHRANLLDPELTAVGIAVVSTAGTATTGGASSGASGGVTRTTAAGANGGPAGGAMGGAAGMLFAVEDFSQSVANLNYQEQEKQVNALLAARGLSLIDVPGGGAVEEARKTCEMDRGWAGSRPGLVVRYEAGDLSRLPDDLEQKIQSARYRAAAVGACDAGSARGFTRFRIAVLLF
jgi:uncharacterized protein YkwD